MRSPFKFLDAYTIEDKDQFFGRELEIEELYRTVFKTPLLLVYGLSGTGKTSLVQCGLAGKFEGPDWRPFFIRRQENINTSLREMLEEALPVPMPADLPEAVQLLFRYSLRPIYLIFDQFEDLFILGDWEEQQELVHQLKALLDTNLPCTVIFVIREEYIGRLYNFEKVIPTLFDFRLRVEPMTNQKVKEVLYASFERFNIEAAPSEKVVLPRIIDNLSAGRSGIQLPYLQIYLDLLYRENYRGAYGDRDMEEPLPPLTFSSEDIDRFGEIEDVLDKFLRRQSAELQELLAKKYSDLPDGAVRNILDSFVTEEGTKRPVQYRRDPDSGLIQLEEKVSELIGPLPPKAVSDCLHWLEQSRLIRMSDDFIELAHDSLAALIDERRTDEQRRLNEIQRRIQNNYLEYQRSGEFLSEKQLNAFEEYFPLIQLDPEVQQFIEKSYGEVKRKKAQAVRRRRLFFSSILLSVLALAAVLLWVNTQKKNRELQMQLIKIQELTYKNYLSNAEGWKNNGSYQRAIDSLKSTLAFLDAANPSLPNSAGKKDSVTNLTERYERLDSLIEKGDQWAQNENTWVQTLEAYVEAYEVNKTIDPDRKDNFIQTKIEYTYNRINERKEELKEKINNFSQREENENTYQSVIQRFGKEINKFTVPDSLEVKVSNILEQG